MAVLACSGCVALPSYRTTAQRLSGEETFDGLGGIRMQWRRLGNEGTQNVPDEERNQAREALEACVEVFESVYSRVPRESVQVVQLMECMRDRGWHLAVDEFFIVTGD
jgi:hypothetical protein